MTSDLSPLETPPLTPLANLKVLIAAASTAALDLENEGAQQKGEGVCPQGMEGGGSVGDKDAAVTEGAGEPGVGGGCRTGKGAKETEDAGGRKMKSLAVLCKR